MKVLVIGLDGVCLPVLDSMSERGVVPALDTAREEGVVSPLESQLPPWTPSAWPSLYTGVNPGKHGVFDFLYFEGYDWDLVNRSQVKEFSVWELLSMHGFSSVVLNVPVTHPPREFDGVIVPGYVAPENPDCHPSGVWSELERNLDEYSLYGGTLDSRSDEELASDLVDLTRMRGDAFRYLADEYDPDFGFVQFQTTDTVFHEFPDDDAVIQRVYRTVDEEVDKLFETTDTDVTLVVSDHGIGPMEGREFRLNNFLRDEGWLVSTIEGSGMPAWKPMAREDATGATGAVDSLATLGVELAASAGLTSQRISAVLQRFGLREWVLETVPLDLVRTGAEQVDFEASTAYMRTRTEMGVRLNLEGREPAGTVSPTAYEDVRTEVMQALEQVVTESADPVFESVHRREDVFNGPYLEDAPDIVTVPNRFDHYLVANLKESTFGPPTEPWEHKRDGVLVANGPNIDSTVELTGAHLLDVAPTVLASFGLPVSERMDRNPLPVVDGSGRESYPQFDASPVRTDSAVVEERLSDLGYLQ